MDHLSLLLYTSLAGGQHWCEGLQRNERSNALVSKVSSAVCALQTEVPGQLNPSLSPTAWQAQTAAGRGSSWEHKSSTGLACYLLWAQQA